MKLSAWCQMAPGVTHHDAQHKVCEMRVAAGQIAALDHIRPYSLGGADTLDNLQTLCRSCNSRKGARV